ncbi:MAG: patatin-like phospholipase family protein [Beijerinckiaceae bacterium]
MDAKVRPGSIMREDECLFPGWRPDGCTRVALLLQGGGALGAYQAGVYEALHDAGIEPDSVTGVSIGAVNGAIIAGNTPQHRVEKLRGFWDKITERTISLFEPDGDIYRRMHAAASTFTSLNLGQPGFFKPYPGSPLFRPAGSKTATSLYDTSPLRDSLAEFVDFSLINDLSLRFAVGAVNVITGNFVYFDNRDEEIGPEHILASSAVPSSFPMVKIGTDYYWDGGLVSNTPLIHLLKMQERKNTLAFQVDLYSARGPLPRDLRDVFGRAKDIASSSRTRFATEIYQQMHSLRAELHEALEKIPPELLTDEERRRKKELSNLPQMTLLQLIYQQKTYEGYSKDYEFSASSMREHWQCGYEDTKRTLKHKHWLNMPADGAGILVHDVHRLREEE